MKVLIVINTISALYNFRKEFVEELISNNHSVFIVAPNNNVDNMNYFEKKGCVCYSKDINRRGMNPFSELSLYRFYKKTIKIIKPDFVFTYTIKPNVYCGAICGKLGLSYAASVTGLGVSFSKKGLLQTIASLLYKKGMRNAKKVFFQNRESMTFFVSKKIVNENQALLVSGSGVNLDEHPYLPYPSEESVNFVFIARILKEKGIDCYLEAAKVITKKYDNVYFHVFGWVDSNYEQVIQKNHDKGVIIYHGPTNNINSVLSFSNCTVLPSFHEGTSNVLLESASCGRPVIASNIPGCNNTFDEGESGIGVVPGKTETLINAIEKFLSLSSLEREEMGRKGRAKMVKEFDRHAVVNKYMEVLTI